MPVLRRLSRLMPGRSGKVKITPVVCDEIRDISKPTGFKHDRHVGFCNGEFVGLPSSWEQWLQTSNIAYVLLYAFHFTETILFVFCFESGCTDTSNIRHFGPKTFRYCVWCWSVSHFCVGHFGTEVPKCLGQFGTKVHETLRTQN